MLILVKPTYLELEIHEVQEAHGLEVDKCLYMVYDASSCVFFFSPSLQGLS